MRSFFNYMIILWILSLITLGIVSALVQDSIEEQRVNERVDKGEESGDR